MMADICPACKEQYFMLVTPLPGVHTPFHECVKCGYVERHFTSPMFKLDVGVYQPVPLRRSPNWGWMMLGDYCECPICSEHSFAVISEDINMTCQRCMSCGHFESSMTGYDTTGMEQYRPVEPKRFLPPVPLRHSPNWGWMMSYNCNACGSNRVVVAPTINDTHMVYCATCGVHEIRSSMYPIPTFQSVETNPNVGRRMWEYLDKGTPMNPGQRIKKPPQEYRPPIPLQRSMNWGMNNGWYIWNVPSMS